MIDSATGVKVRLRLGVHSDQDGEKLAIFYKLFTSRPVIDLCELNMLYLTLFMKYFDSSKPL